MGMDIAQKVAYRYASSMEAATALKLERAVSRLPAVRGSLVTDYSQPRAGMFDVAMDVVLRVATSTQDGMPVRFQGSVPGISGAITRTLTALGASKVAVTPPSLVKGVRGTLYESDVMLVTFEVSDAPL